jgi:hypothetical protein
MKIRTGFVSNSSSSSFMAMVSRDGMLIEYITARFVTDHLPTDEDGETVDWSWWDLPPGCSRITENGYDSYRISGTSLDLYVMDECLDFVGIDAEGLFNDGLNKDQIREKFLEQIRGIGYTRILMDEPRLEYGEWGSG